jgi:hypothetical protein
MYCESWRRRQPLSKWWAEIAEIMCDKRCYLSEQYVAILHSGLLYVHQLTCRWTWAASRMPPLKHCFLRDATSKHYWIFGYDRRVGQICNTAADVSSQHARSSSTAFWVSTGMARFHNKAEDSSKGIVCQGPCDHHYGDNARLVYM